MLLLTIFAAGWRTGIRLRIVAPSFVIVTSPFDDWIYTGIRMRTHRHHHEANTQGYMPHEG